MKPTPSNEDLQKEITKLNKIGELNDEEFLELRRLLRAAARQEEQNASIKYNRRIQLPPVKFTD